MISTNFIKILKFITWILLLTRLTCCGNEIGSFDTFGCCGEVFGSCRSACENFSLVQLAADPDGRDSRLPDVKRNCPLAQTEFWHCMNRTLDAVSRGSQWSGRFCCPLGISTRCQNACATSSSRNELITGAGCRQSDEQNLFSCFDRQDAGDECCGNARTSECLQVCRDIFRSRSTPPKELRQLVEKVCNDNNTNSKVLNCVQAFTDLTPINNSKQFLPCCDYTSNLDCQTICKNSLNTNESTQEIIDLLERGGCGPPLPHDPLWQCFLSPGRRSSSSSSLSSQLSPSSSSGSSSSSSSSSSTNEISQINQIGMDSAKLHCCHKAFAPKCRRLCVQTFSNDWTETRRDFEFDCYSQINEMSLRQCLDEVDEPCELGCDGLSFCTNFNNRPTELFRSCNIQADNAAQADVTLWKEKGSLSLPNLNIPIKNITNCSPEIWQAIVCTLQIKPCARNKHATQICREDCYDILTKCMDWTKLDDVRHTAASICSKFSLEDSTAPCISLKPYLEPSDLPHHSGNHEVVTPCNGHRCNSTEVCLVNNDGTSSVGYSCIPGCPLGETSFYMVPLNTYVRIPVSLKQKGCLKICRCAASGRIENCQPLPCITYDSCTLTGRKIDHASWFYVECNICSCFAGEITCTKKQCHIPGISDLSFTSLPCNCPPHHVPVCGRNGNTYPSACVAKCSGLQDADFEFGPCRKVNACENVQCPGNGRCIENRQVCLSVMHRPCQQYQCVNITKQCPSLSMSQPVCSIEKQTFPSICHLLKAKTKLDYRGPCLSGCRYEQNEPICGINGVTYKSECDAWSDYSWQDYVGECREVGLLSDIIDENRCNTVKCSALPNEHCQPIIPPGACCPICSGALRIVYSRKQIDRALYALKGKNLDFLSLKGVLHSLERLIRVNQCRIIGYLTMEMDIFVSVQSTLKSPSYVQYESCNREAEKIATLIETQSHRITSDLALSSLTVANLVPPTTSFNCGATSVSIFKWSIIYLFSTFSLIIYKWIYFL